MPTAPFSIRFDTNIKSRLDQEAKREDRSAGYIVQKAVLNYLDAKEFKRRCMLDAEAELDRGVFVSWEKTKAWMESWDTDAELPMPEPDILPGKA